MSSTSVVNTLLIISAEVDKMFSMAPLLPFRHKVLKFNHINCISKRNIFIVITQVHNRNTTLPKEPSFQGSHHYLLSSELAEPHELFPFILAPPTWRNATFVEILVANTN